MIQNGVDITLKPLTAPLWIVFVLFQVGGAYSYDCSFGYIPNVELMKFISLATFGSYLPSCPDVDLNSQEMNTYHKAFLTYSFLNIPESLNSEYFCGETAMQTFKSWVCVKVITNTLNNNDTGNRCWIYRHRQMNAKCSEN